MLDKDHFVVPAIDLPKTDKNKMSELKKTLSFGMNDLQKNVSGKMR